jgi:multidrug efflux pump subunit AcrB
MSKHAGPAPAPAPVTMSMPKDFRRARATVLGVFVVLLAWGTNSMQPSLAAWTTPEYVSATITSGRLYPVTSLTCNAASGLLATGIGLTWTQPMTTGNGLVPTGYTVTWSGTAGSGQKTVTGLTTTVPGSILSVAGTSTVTVSANSGTWRSPVSTQSRLLTTISALGAIVSWSCA